jgi:TPR repeat protein
LLYSLGQGIPQSFAESYLWLDLAAAGAKGEDQARYAKTRDSEAVKLSPDELSKAQERAAKWFADHPTKH